MRRVMLLELLAMALPMAALANSINAPLWRSPLTQFTNGMVTRDFSRNLEILVHGSVPDLAPNSMAPLGAIARWDSTFAAPTGNSLAGGSASIVALPEPGRLACLELLYRSRWDELMLADKPGEMVRRRLKLET
jgi:hypothetical protein